MFQKCCTYCIFTLLPGSKSHYYSSIPNILYIITKQIFLLDKYLIMKSLNNFQSSLRYYIIYIYYLLTIPETASPSHVWMSGIFLMCGHLEQPSILLIVCSINLPLVHYRYKILYQFGKQTLKVYIYIYHLSIKIFQCTFYKV